MIAPSDTGIVPDPASNWQGAEFNVFGDGQHDDRRAHGAVSLDRVQRERRLLRDGTALKAPVSTDDLHKRFARSWLVLPRESLFAEHPIASAAPARQITAADLGPNAYAKAHAACAAAGVTDPAHLDSCTLDTAVFKTTVAIRAFTRAIAPRIVLRPAELGVQKQR